MKNLELHLLPVISKVLQSSSKPLVCEELYAQPEINALAPSAHLLAGYLGRLWRDGMLNRVLPPSKVMGGANWAYAWKGSNVVSTGTGEPVTTVLADRRSALITQKDGEITVEMPRLVISVPGKPPGAEYLEGLKRGMSD
jgi:hypothetical protein